MTQEELDQQNKKRLWVWITVLVMMFVFAAEDACDLRRNNLEIEKNAYFLICSSEQSP